MTKLLGVDVHSTVSADEIGSGSIPLSELGGRLGDDGLRRNHYGHLLVVPPGETKPKGYVRVTTIAKELDTQGGLIGWKATMAVCGTLLRPGVRAAWEVLLATHPSPWYGGAEPKAKCKRLVEEAAEAGGATDRREQGTALHAITALIDSGQTPHHLSEETERDLAAYRATLALYGVEIIPDMIETTVVLDSYRVGGSFDRLVKVQGYDLPMIADLKTGADISYSDGSFAVQLAAYSRAEAIYRQGADPNGSTDERAPMPEVDQTLGLVIWLPAGEGRCELRLVSLEAGWEGFELSWTVRAWRNRRGLSAPMTQFSAPEPLAAVPDPEPEPEPPETPVDTPPVTVNETAGSLRVAGPSPAAPGAGGDSLPPAAPVPAAPPVTSIEVSTEPEVEPSVPAGEQAIRAWLEGRIETVQSFGVEPVSVVEVRAWIEECIAVIGRHSPDARTDLARSWPDGVPILRAGTEHTVDQLAAIETVLHQIEARHEVPFGAPRPGSRDDASYMAERRVLATFPGSTVVS